MPFEIGLDPVAFHVGGLAVHWYGIIVVLASAVAGAVVLREARRPSTAISAGLFGGMLLMHLGGHGHGGHGGGGPTTPGRG